MLDWLEGLWVCECCHRTLGGTCSIPSRIQYVPRYIGYPSDLMSSHEALGGSNLLEHRCLALVMM